MLIRRAVAARRLAVAYGMNKLEYGVSGLLDYILVTEIMALLTCPKAGS